MRKEEGLEQYFREISRNKLLTLEEEQEISNQLRLGNTEVRERLIKSNLRLVVSIAKNFVRRGLPLMDLISEGNVGLIKASKKYNPDKGCKFSTYAMYWINQSIKRALIETVKTIRIPSYMITLLEKWKQAKQLLTADLARLPSNEEIATYLNLSHDQLDHVKSALKIRNARYEMISINSDGSGTDLVADSSLLPEDEVDKKMNLRSLGFLLAQLTERQRDILKLRYGLFDGMEKTLKEVGKKYNLSRERVRQIEVEALQRLHTLSKQRKATLLLQSQAG